MIPSSTIRRYTPDSALANPGLLFTDMRHNLQLSLPLARALFLRDLKAQFRQSALGYAWLFFPPIATTAVWFFLNSSGVVEVADTGIPYPAFVMIGTLLWQTFLDSLNRPIQALTGARGIMTKLNIPREAPILAGVASSSVTAGIRLLLLIPVFIFLDLSLSWQVLLFPLAYILIVIAGASLGVLLTPVGMLYTDIGKGIQMLGQFLMYTAPVVYPMAEIGLLGTVNRWNPVTPLLQFGRSTLSGGPLQALSETLLVSALCMVVLFFAWTILQIVLPRIIERMGM
jgi:lipopolysaccharide transport system permease protein